MGLFPKMLGGFQCVDFASVPPRGLIAGLMKPDGARGRAAPACGARSGQHSKVTRRSPSPLNYEAKLLIGLVINQTNMRYPQIYPRA